ncbi:hypothetical protein KHP62_14750 [Rhodobacteraceae bacterium NNCM2]|nr:hypothetical protein [Coraliihabitans acroporae]
MTKQLLVWTVLPFGRVADSAESPGGWCVSAVVSPRLTPEAPDEQVIAAFEPWLDWPSTVAAANFSLRIGPETTALNRVTQPDSELWGKLVTKETPVAGFQYKDMSQVNLHSYPVRNVLSFAKKHYGRLSVQSASTHPTLLPWNDAHPDLKGMLQDIGTRTQKIPFGDRQVEVALPGFSRFYDGKVDDTVRESVFGEQSLYRMPVPGTTAGEQGTPRTASQARRRVLNPDWTNPRRSRGGARLSGAADAALMDQFHSADEYTFYQADRFYRRDRTAVAMRYPDYANIPDPPTVPEYDFHRIIASYANYPELLRRLGLVIDFLIEDASLIESRVAAGGGTGLGQMQLVIDWPGGAPGEEAFPRTAWLAHPDRFVPRPRGNTQVAGLLRLEDSDDSWGIAPNDDKKEGLFDLYQVDPDGAAIKTVNFTLTAQNLVSRSLSLTQKHGEVTYTTGNRQPVAALRSAGLGVSQHGRAVELATNAAAADLKNSEIINGNADKVVLFAEDVHRGYRVDIAHVPDLIKPGKWFTLCAREGDYRLTMNGEPIKLPADEGHVSGASTSGDRNDEHYLHESLFRWTGWSLVASRPGLTIKAETNDDDQLQAEVPTTVTDTAAEGNGLAATFKPVKGSLPRLRFGEFYRVRARIVDLAGNSLAVDDPSIEPLEQASDAVGYWRFEPVDPPAMVHRGRVSEGESLERMVIRSNFDSDAATYMTTTDFTAAIAGPDSVDFEYTAINERHLVPPKSSQQQCETHGLFDPFFGAWDDIKKGYEIAAREAGTLYDAAPGAQVELVTPTIVSDVATTNSVPPALPDETNPVGDRMAGGQYVIHREAHLETPYLPDGAAGGVAIRAVPGHDLPGVSGEMTLGDGCDVVLSDNQHLVLRVRHSAPWPGSDGFRLILAERAGSHTELPCAESFPDEGRPVWDPQARTLTLFVAKGRIVRLVYASFIHPEFIDSFGMPRWTNSAQEADFCARTAMDGVNWLMTPYRSLTLVHALQQPLCLPELENFTPRRGLGDHDAELLCRTVRLHGPSTGKFEIEADWKEWVDDLQKPRPERVSFKGQLGEVKLAENHANEFPLRNAVDAQLADPEAARGDVHALGDTRFRLVHYRARATTRFREYLPPPLYDDPEKISRLGPVAVGPAVALPPEDDPGAPVLRHRDGSVAQSIVPASAPPKDPRLLYVVPTFHWGDRAASGPLDVTRLGNGLRVWLDRPWFTSGDGELLGVVIHDEGGRFTDIPPAMQALVTQWGMDPLWDTALPKTQTRARDFSARVRTEAISLHERPDDPAVRIVGHRVHWDDTRALWYCDIELDPGASYMPFVRLALVRFQPNALPDARISQVVLADFAQVLPRRRLKASIKGDQITVSLHGPNPNAGPLLFTRDSAFQNVSFSNGPFETGRNRVEVVLQEQEAGIDSDLGWEDVQTLANRVVGADGAESDGPLIARPDLGGRLVTRRAGGSVELEAVIDRGEIGITTPFLRDPAFWSDTFDAPATGSRHRLVIREFERFYSDNTKNQKVGTGTFPRRVIEERLVFADIIDPAALAQG